MFSINEKIHMIYHMITLWWFDTPNKLKFGKFAKKYAIDSILQVEPSWKLIICKSHVKI